MGLLTVYRPAGAQPLAELPLIPERWSRDSRPSATKTSSAKETVFPEPTLLSGGRYKSFDPFIQYLSTVWLHSRTRHITECHRHRHVQLDLVHSSSQGLTVVQSSSRKTVWVQMEIWDCQLFSPSASINSSASTSTLLFYCFTWGASVVCCSASVHVLGTREGWSVLFFLRGVRRTEMNELRLQPRWKLTQSSIVGNSTVSAVWLVLLSC